MANNESYREVRSPNDILSFIEDYKININCFTKCKGGIIARGSIFEVYAYTEQATNKKVAANNHYICFRYVKNQANVSYEEDSINEINIEKKINVNVEPISLEQFKKLNKIGSGSFGKVYKVLEKETGNIYACKISSKSVNNCNDAEIKNLQREVEIIAKLNHPVILKFIGFNPVNFKKDDRPTFITELITNGSLDKIIEIERLGLSGDNWDDTMKLINIYGIAKGMSYLHSLNILHRDLKPGNIFIDEHLFPKIGDFGLSKELTIKNDTETSEGSSMEDSQSGDLGTHPYMSPEIIKFNKYTKPGDVYAFALIVYQIITNEELYVGFTRFMILMNVANGYRPNIPSDTIKCYRELIEKCWNQNPNERPTFDDIVEELENNPDFITDTVDENEFFNYVDYIKQLVPNNEQEQKLENDAEKLIQSFQKISIDLKLADDSYDENDPEINKCFLDLTKYEEVKFQSKGSTWKLVEVKNKETGEIFSAKIITIKLSKMNRSNVIKLSREINNVSQLMHPSILKFIGYSLKDLVGKKRPVIVSEYAINGTISGVLEQERQKQHVLEWDETKKLINIYGIAEGMRYLHLNKIIHRDLTPENIFLDEKFNPKIGGFGLSIHIHTQDSMTFQSTVGVKGNPVYSPPEVLQKNEYSKSSDVYSFGMIVYEIMTNKIPFEKLINMNQLFNEVVLKSSRPEINDLPEAYRQLIECCWDQNPENRPNFDEIADILKKDSRFITDKIESEKYLEYIKSIENSTIEFYEGKKIFKQDFIISKSNTNSNETDSSDDEDVDANKEKITKEINEPELIETNIKEVKEPKEQEAKIKEVEEPNEQKTKIKVVEDLESSEKQEAKIEDIEELKEQESKIEETEEPIKREVNIEDIEELKEQESKIEVTEESEEREVKIKDINEPIEREIKIEETENSEEREVKIEDIEKLKEQESKIKETEEPIGQEIKIEETENSKKQEANFEDIEELKEQESKIEDTEDSEERELKEQIDFQNNLSEDKIIFFEKAENPILIKKKSTNQNQEETSCELAKKYSIENDTESTYIYMNKSISEGHSLVALEYAVQLYKTKHFKESMKYFIKLSKINHPIAKYFIGIMKYFGQGCEEDRIESHNIMKYLSENGIERATEFIENHFD